MPAAFARCRCLNLYHRSVSHPRSSNRACGFLAHGFPIDFTSKPTAAGLFTNKNTSRLLSLSPLKTALHCLNCRRVVTLQSRVARGRFCWAWAVGLGKNTEMGRDSKKVLNLCKKRREALAPAPSTKKSPPHGSKRTARTPRPGNHFAFTPDLNP